MDSDYAGNKKTKQNKPNPVVCIAVVKKKNDGTI